MASYWFKPRAKGRDIVDQQLPTLLFVCTLCCMWLVVVAQSFKLVSGQTLSQRLPTFLLFRDRRSVAQPCWIRLLSSSNIVGATHVHYRWFPKTYGLYPSPDALQVPTLLGVVAAVCTPLPTPTRQLPTLLAQHCWESLHPFAHHCQHQRDNSQHCWPNIVGSCCIRLHTTANTNATTPNIVGPTMLFAVATIADDTLSPFIACRNEIWAGEEFYWYADKAESEMDERSDHQNVAPVGSGCEAICSRRNSSQATSNQKGCVNVRLLCAAVFVVLICILFCNLVHSTSWQRKMFFFPMSWMWVRKIAEVRSTIYYSKNNCNFTAWLVCIETTLIADEVIFSKEMSNFVKCFLKNTNVSGLSPFFSMRKKPLYSATQQPRLSKSNRLLFVSKWLLRQRLCIETTGKSPGDSRTV